MKNNSLAMVATISLVLSVASMISYIDPAVCAGSQTEGFVTCEQAAQQHILGFWGFMAFGIITLVAGTIRNRIVSNRNKD
jgi:hypothetical protein